METLQSLNLGMDSWYYKISLNYRYPIVGVIFTLYAFFIFLLIFGSVSAKKADNDKAKAKARKMIAVGYIGLIVSVLLYLAGRFVFWTSWTSLK